VIRDPFYRQILERLAGSLDGDLFEVCAASLLRNDFPTLVPIRGGTDSGMDGATASPGPFLVCTTGTDVIRNLAKNLNSYKRSGGPRHAVVVATSQELSQKRRANLEAKARSLGFNLRHVYDREAVAERLYHEPRWCKELLGLTGRPSALTTIPRTDRPLLDHPLVGREEDIKWLRETSGDRLIVGQPGCGKTFLLRSLALEGWGLFLADDDLGAVADAVRAQQPRVVIVDDAHFRLAQLTDLRRLRAEVTADFDIVAASWEGDKDQVAEALLLPGAQVRALGLLTRDEIVEVTKHAGLGGPVELIREIVDQSEGRPGLAVTLSYLSLNGDARDVYLGEALGRSLGATFRKLVGQEANDILGSFALGGDRGMAMQTVSEALGVSLLQLRVPLVRLAAGGVLRENYEGRISVWPRPLRYVLVRDTFFGGRCDLPAETLMAAAPDKADMAETLVGAVARGADVPHITDILEAVGSPRVWAEYASLGEKEAKAVLRRHPEMLRAVGQVTLRLAPVETLPLLFHAAIGDERRLGNAVDHPLRWIQDWVEEAYPGEGQAVLRRRILIAAARRWLEDGGDERVGDRAALIALNPTFRSGATDPGGGMKFTLTSGLLTKDELAQMREVWAEARSLLAASREPPWEKLFSAVNPWAYPGYGRVDELPTEIVGIMYSVAAEMVRDIAGMSRERPGVQQWARRMVDKLQVKIETAEDREFEILFPEFDRGEGGVKELERELEIVSSLAKEWAIRPASEIAARLIRLEREASAVGKNWPRWTVALCEMIAGNVEDPNPWLGSLIARQAPSDTVEPFLRKVVAARTPGWGDALARCFGVDGLERQAVYILLTLDDAPEEPLRRALAVLPKYFDMVETICLRDQVPESTLKLLLRHESPAVSSNAAVGAWCSDPEHEIREGIREDWREAILRAEGLEFWLPEILKSNSGLAYEWLERHVGRESIHLSHFIMEEVKAALSSLDFKQRASLLGHLKGEGYAEPEIISHLTGNDLRMYGEILKHRKLAKYHLSPLQGHPTGLWADKAVLALNAGYTPAEIVQASIHFIQGWVGRESDMWQGWVNEFEALARHDDPRVREAAAIGAAKAREHRANALSGERAEAIYGR
jgi:hypothetical protein